MKKGNILKLFFILLILFEIVPVCSLYASMGFNSLALQNSNSDANLRCANSEYEIIQITNNEVNDNIGCLDDGLIVWTSDILGNGKREIFLYNVFTGETTRISYNDYDDTQPRIDNGIITWIGKVDDDYEIFLYDIHLSSPEPYRITYNNVDDSTPLIHEGLITWYTGDFKIWLYDYNTLELIQVTDNFHSGLYPKVHEGLVTWMGGGDIWLYDYKGILGTPQRTIQITSDSYTNPDSFPYIDDGLIIWHSKQEIDGKPFIKLYLYDCFTGETHHIGDPKYSYGKIIHDGLVAYGGRELTLEGNDLDEEIYLYDYATGITTQITFNDVYDEAPAIHDGIIAWSRTYQIFIYNCLNGETIKITDNGSGFSVIIHDGLLLWHSNRDSGGFGDYEIYFARPVFITANINMDPDTLNLKCKGKWVTGYIELPSGYNVAEIDITTVLLQNSIPAELSPTSIGDFDEDGILDLMVKFDRASLQSLVSIGDAVEILISGALTNGVMFSGFDFIKVIDQGNDHINEENPSSVL